MKEPALTVRRMSLLMLLSPTLSPAAEFRAAVAAGRSDRNHAPVFADLELPDALPAGPATVTSNGNTEPAQLERLSAGKARVWWMVYDLPAGRKQVYTIRTDQGSATGGPAGFYWKDTSKADGKSMDLLFGKQPVLRYVYTPFDKGDLERTKKPFHHVFDPNGSRLITKGVGGKYSHHRGIFFGYKECSLGGQSYDTWHAGNGAHQLHRQVLRELTGPIVGGHVVEIHWNDRQGKPFIEETRRVVAYRQPKDRLLIEFTSTLRPTRGLVRLSGDRQHAGVQFRAAQEVADNEKATRYLRPAGWGALAADEEINTPEHKDLPWNAIQYKLGGRPYTVAYLGDPKNPAGAEFSERLYGRFGEYFPWELRRDNTLLVRYRWWVTASPDVSRNLIEQKYQDLADPPKVELLK